MAKMAETNNFVLQVDDDRSDITQDQLVFQDIPHSHKTSLNSDGVDGKHVQTHTFTNFPNPDESDEEDKEALIDKNKKSLSFWKFEYYQSFFNIDSKQVVDRILWSMFPNPKVNYLQMKLRPNPDLYGPFWICTTLVLTIAIAGNLSNYFYYHGDETHTWKYDFNKVTLSAAAIFTYWWMMPTLLSALLWWRGNQAGYTFTEIICLYGYSLAIYVPISVLWVLPFQWLQWLLVMLGMALSGTVLVFTLWPSVRHDRKEISLATMIIVVLMHGLLAIGFILYFFKASVETVVTTSSSPATSLALNNSSTRGGFSSTTGGFSSTSITSLGINGSH